MISAQHRPVLNRPLPAGLGGRQRIYRFDNGYGASVVQGSVTYGGDASLFELAVIRFQGESNEEFTLVYDTPITDDVEGYLDPEDVRRLLDLIEALPGGSA